MRHRCHWPGCPREVPPARWGCPQHWFQLPKELRDAVWAAYVPGQEITKTPSRHYLEVVGQVEAWIRNRIAELAAEAATKPPTPTTRDLFS